MSRWRHRRNEAERGFVMILTSLLMVGLLSVVALVVDMGALRTLRRSTQSTADFAALAAGAELGTPTGQDPVSACRAAIRYVNVNLHDLPSSLDPVGFCSQPGQDVGATTCSGGGLTQAAPVQVVGPYTVGVSYPVLDSDIVDPKTGGHHINDGTACSRLKVSISRASQGFFGAIIPDRPRTAKAVAVVRELKSTTPLIPALWLLDPHDCTGFNVGGTGTTVNVGSPGVPGVVIVESDGSNCTGGQVTLDANGGATLTALPTSGTFAPQRKISLLAMPVDATTCSSGTSHDCDMADVPSNITLQPSHLDQRATRAPVDWKYNCKASYPDYLNEVKVAGCIDQGERAPFIDDLAAAVGSSGPIPGFVDYNGPCTPSGTMPAGNLRITCSNFSVKNNVTFPGQNVVFDGDVSVSAGGSLVFNAANPTAALPAGCIATVCATQSSARAAFMYLRNGAIGVNGGGSFDLRNTTVIQKGGDLRFGGGGTPLWSASIEGPFNGLAYWDETPSNGYSISGGASMSMTGVFFTPLAFPFSIAGGSPAVQQHAQFVSRSLTITGGGTLNLAPDNQAVSVPPSAATLIR